MQKYGLLFQFDKELAEIIHLANSNPNNSNTSRHTKESEDQVMLDDEATQKASQEQPTIFSCPEHPTNPTS